MEIVSHQLSTTSRQVETTRPPVSFYAQQTAPGQSPKQVPEQEQTPAQKREQQRYEQAVQSQLQKLQARDAEVRAHEAAHIAAGGQYVSSGPNYTYQRGPNGRYYAIGGEVSLDVSAIPNDPEGTLNKAEVVRRAALAPAQPSPQDHQVAANAARMASRARIDIAIQQREQQQVNRGEQQGTAISVSGVDRADVGGAYGSATLAEPAKDVFDIVA